MFRITCGRTKFLRPLLCTGLCELQGVSPPEHVAICQVSLLERDWTEGGMPAESRAIA